MRDTKLCDRSSNTDLLSDGREPSDLVAIATMLQQIARWSEDYGLREAVEHVEEARSLVLRAIERGRHLQ
ncbi:MULTISPECIES: hypothetical protein [unclassified Aureimonas]|uniref:hypothetical protein n=1 Tax=unclassified Aureimonas TaxID=2615206 RepID=UPI00071F1BAF|nr:MULTISPECIES: hypothetical protein [unclassified Aureimonas]ALN74914.1 hypothetical protein M673_19495 [Aureimonas sp. AU20]